MPAIYKSVLKDEQAELGISTGVMRYLFFFYLLIHCANCFAQGNSQGASSNKGFIPREHIIFEDNFNDDSSGHPPHKWKRMINYSVRGTKTHAIVGQDGPDKVLGTDGITYVKPILQGALTDSFTIECDFMLKDKEDYLGLAFRLGKSDKNSIDSDFYQFLFFYDQDHYRVFHGIVDVPFRDLDSYKFGPPVVFFFNHWYHLGFSYNHRRVSCYLDSTMVLDIPDGGFPPFDLFIRLDSNAICKSIIITNGKLLDFTRLIKEKKFVTHAILFEYNKAVISDDSDPFLAQLAGWLLKNPGISIEIDGHTDSIGNAASNLNLSVKRAEEVRRQLMTKGVSAARLTTKGLGSTMPLRSNKTEEGRSENRRVEFILLEK